MKKILIIRNDKLGDFMLIWPALAMLKASLPDSHLTALVPAYTADIARACPYLDDIIIDAGKNAAKDTKNQVLDSITQCHFDASINFFSDFYNASLVFKAGIPTRVAPATKLFQFLYNQRLWQRRSQSKQPEYVYNIELVRYFLQLEKVSPKEVSAPYWQFDSHLVEQQKAHLVSMLGLDSRIPWVFVHAGTGGSANNLSLHQYAELIESILCNYDTQIVLTAGPAEVDKVHLLKTLIKKNAEKVFIYDKNQGMVDFAQSIACASVFIGGSTGPLHIAGALNNYTVGFYPSKRSATPLRWQTINDENKRLAVSPSQTKETQDDLTSISITKDVCPSLFTFLDRILN